MTNTLRFHRSRVGLFQKDVAKALGLECMDRISHWENGIAMPSVINLFKLSAIYGVLPHELYPELYKASAKPEQPDVEDRGIGRVSETAYTKTT